VRSPDDGNADGPRVPIFLWLRLESLQDPLHEVITTLRVRGRYRQRLTDPERVEVGASRVGIQSLGLVERERYRFAGAPQLAQAEMVLRSPSRTGIDEKYQPIRLFHGALGLLAHLRFDADGVLDEPPRIDDHIGNGPDPAEPVLSVASQSR